MTSKLHLSKCFCFCISFTVPTHSPLLHIDTTCHLIWSLFTLLHAHNPFDACRVPGGSWGQNIVGINVTSYGYSSKDFPHTFCTVPVNSYLLLHFARALGYFSLPGPSNFDRSSLVRPKIPSISAQWTKVFSSKLRYVELYRHIFVYFDAMSPSLHCRVSTITHLSTY